MADCMVVERLPEFHDRGRSALAVLDEVYKHFTFLPAKYLSVSPGKYLLVSASADPTHLKAEPIHRRDYLEDCLRPILHKAKALAPGRELTLKSWQVRDDKLVFVFQATAP